MNELNDSEFKCLWQQQPTEDLNVTLTDIRSKATAFHKQTKFRNAVYYALALLMIVVYGITLIANRDQILTVVACALIVAANLFVMYYLRSKGSVTAPPVDGDTHTYLIFMSAEFKRQRNLMRDFFRWYLAPLIPGLALLLIDKFLRLMPRHRIGLELSLVGCFAVVAIAFVCGYLVVQIEVRKLQARVDKTDATLKSLANGPAHR